MKILVLNCGSSSIKFQLIETDIELIESDTDRCIAKGSVERIGTDEATLKVTVPPESDQVLDGRDSRPPDGADAGDCDAEGIPCRRRHFADSGGGASSAAWGRALLRPGGH